MRFLIRGYAESTVACYSEEEWSEEWPEIEAACESLRLGAGRALVVSPETIEQVVAGLIVLSNTEDEIAERERRQPIDRRDSERLRSARAASIGLSTLASRIARAFG